MINFTMQGKLNKRTCANCGVMFQKDRPLQNCCTPKCAYERSRKLTQAKIDKEEKAEIKEKKESLLTHSDYIQLFQKVFNQYIRLRDKNEPCISCGCLTSNKWDAGHLYPTTYQFLRFNEWNVNKQCSFNCNMKRSGNAAEYRPRLEAKIGSDAMQWLHAHRHDRLELSIPEIKEKIAEYKLKIKALK